MDPANTEGAGKKTPAPAAIDESILDVKATRVMLLVGTWFVGLVVGAGVYSYELGHAEWMIIPPICLVPGALFGLPEALFGMHGPPGPIKEITTNLTLGLTFAELALYIWLSILTITTPHRERARLALLVLAALIILNLVASYAIHSNGRFW